VRMGKAFLESLTKLKTIISKIVADFRIKYFKFQKKEFLNLIFFFLRCVSAK
jgi:hypothetical protein